MKTTMAQLPGLKKAGQILKLQEYIASHRKMATQLLQDFNFLHNCIFEGSPVSAECDNEYLQRAEQIQEICEWHMVQVMNLEVILSTLQSGS